jgi:hypothetical protein
VFVATIVNLAAVWFKAAELTVAPVSTHAHGIVRIGDALGQVNVV